jgi:hypothetical protein
LRALLSVSKSKITNPSFPVAPNPLSLALSSTTIALFLTLFLFLSLFLVGYNY